TTVANPTPAAGRAAVDMLLQHDGSTSGRIGRGGLRTATDDRRTTAQVTLQTELVVRDSTGPAPGAVICEDKE
ncbi:LacI family transcriptional regulator, partial [Micromonospora sp. CPCC 206061]